MIPQTESGYTSDSDRLPTRLDVGFLESSISNMSSPVFFNQLLHRQTASTSDWSLNQLLTSETSSIHIPEVSENEISYLSSVHHQNVITESQIAWIQIDFSKIQSNSSYVPFSQQSAIPSRYVMNIFVQLYFEHFHPSCPFLHRPTFHNDASPTLIAIVASIGAQYSGLREADSISRGLAELVRRMVALHVSFDNFAARLNDRVIS